jgi:hypothetical protein
MCGRTSFKHALQGGVIDSIPFFVDCHSVYLVDAWKERVLADAVFRDSANIVLCVMLLSVCTLEGAFFSLHEM